MTQPPPLGQQTRAPHRISSPVQCRELSLNAPPPGLDVRRWRDLRRGRTRPERTLDLHGRTAAEAHSAVRSFLAQSRAEGLRCVAIVTGKGAAKGGGGASVGVLRRELPHWLNAAELRPLLLGAAYPQDGNQGAVYLLLRRSRG